MMVNVADAVSQGSTNTSARGIMGTHWYWETPAVGSTNCCKEIGNALGRNSH